MNDNNLDDIECRFVTIQRKDGTALTNQLQVRRRVSVPRETGKNEDGKPITSWLVTPWVNKTPSMDVEYEED